MNLGTIPYKNMHHVSRNKKQLKHNRKNMAYWSNQDIKYQQLFDRLLSIGGVAVCANMEEDLKKIISNGIAWTPKQKDIIHRRGTSCQCHMNSAYIWEENSDDVYIATGYGLTRDGIWRQHSWCVTVIDNCIIETTIKRIAYFGFILGGAESSVFFLNNI